jgi:hypothetical protein
MGLDDKNNVKITYRWEYNPPKIYFKWARDPIIQKHITPDMITPKGEKEHFLLPLNSKKQTILKVKSLKVKSISEESPRDPTLISKKELMITVIDEFNRITVEEIGKTQTK